MKLPSILGNRSARDKPKDSYGGQAYSFFFGRSTSGKTVNERTAMQATAVYSCVRILAEAVASLPIHANACVHAIIEPGGNVYQTLPWEHRGWHCGSSANNTHIGAIR